MEKEKQVGIVYKNLSKEEKLKYIKSIHNKLENYIDLDVHEINFIMSVRDYQDSFAPNLNDINSYLYACRNLSYEFLMKNRQTYKFYWPKIFRILYLDSKYWSAISVIVNRYVEIIDGPSAIENIFARYGVTSYAYAVYFEKIPNKIGIKLQEKAREIYERETKKYRKMEEEEKAIEKDVIENLFEPGELSDKEKKELFNKDENQNNLEM